MEWKPINTALAAFGMSGEVFHAPLLAADRRYCLQAILQRAGDSARDRYPDVEIARSFDAICRDRRIELIVINTPDHTHAELATRALEHGKHVVVEKPFTLTFDDARELVGLARRRDRVLSVFHNRRWDGDFLTVQDIVAKQRLGRLVSYEAHFDRFRHAIPSGTWKEDPAVGTGMLYNIGSHLIDQALMLFGTPASVFADIRILRPGGGVDDSFDIWMDYPDVKVKLCGSYLVREPGPRYSLHGTDGSFLKWGMDPQEQDLKDGRRPDGEDWGIDREVNWGLLHTGRGDDVFRGRVETLPGAYPAYYDSLYRAIRQGQAPAVTADQAALVIRVIEACYASMRARAAIPLRECAASARMNRRTPRGDVPSPSDSYNSAGAAVRESI